MIVDVGRVQGWLLWVSELKSCFSADSCILIVSEVMHVTASTEASWLMICFSSHVDTGFSWFADTMTVTFFYTVTSWKLNDRPLLVSEHRLYRHALYQPLPWRDRPDQPQCAGLLWFYYYYYYKYQDLSDAITTVAGALYKVPSLKGFVEAVKHG